MAQVGKSTRDASRQGNQTYDVSVFSDVEACQNFVPNQWRRTLCQNCFRGYSAHIQQERPPPKWYFAKIEGPFTWEQMRHWYEAGYFAQGPILVQEVDEANGEEVDTTGKGFSNLDQVFADKDLAFIPKDEANRAQQIGIDAAAAGNLLDSESMTKQINPSTLRAYAKAMEVYFSRGDEWYFVDANNERQGPFSSKQITSWYNAGYFWKKDLLLSHAGWQQYVTLEDMMEAASEFYEDMENRITVVEDEITGETENNEVRIEIETEPSEALQQNGLPSQGRVDGEKDETYQGSIDREHDKATQGSVGGGKREAYQAIADREHDQASQGGADREHDEAYQRSGDREHDEGYRRIRYREHDETYQGSADGGQNEHSMSADREHEAAYSVGADGEHEHVYQETVDRVRHEVPDVGEQDVADDDASAASDDQPEWYYIDDAGAVQGPFSTIQMLEWYDNDFLPRNIPIKHIQPQFKYFVPLNRLFDDETVFDYPENWAHVYTQAVEEGNYVVPPHHDDTN
eukprot:gb/GECG01013593.1/.p1 GENE.gb/GECG01013593.1/~~gb/GECG01013593.1/.p1  ORF type:complete len:516 (+),score=103.33 gb/GECG01013593.1/:1-1548(+)